PRVWRGVPDRRRRRLALSERVRRSGSHRVWRDGHRLPVGRRPGRARPSQGHPRGVRAVVGAAPALPAQGGRWDQLGDARQPAEGGELMAVRDEKDRSLDIDVQLVPMRRRHLRSVMRIEVQVYPRPWSLSLFMSELALRSTRTYYVARVEGMVVGYAGLMMTVDDGHITTIAVDPAWQRHRLGSRLLLA